MGKSVTQKILEKHIVEGKFEQGKEIAIRIDQTLTQDATGTMAYLQFEAMGVPKVKTELSVSYIDHNTIQIGFENADDHRYLQSIAAKYGIYLSRAGNGICHQVHLERFGKPTKTLLGSDSHTPTAGGIGMIAIGAGGLDIAVALAGEPFYLTCPKVIKINLTGKLKPWVSAKDVVLKVLEIFSTKGNVGAVFEYGGEGVKSLSVPERATITNMGAECGVTTSIFPSDEITKQFLAAQGRETDWIEAKADPDAEYDRVVDLNLSEVVPLVATPHSPGNIKTVRELSGTPVNQVCIGSCTNSSYKDLMTVAKILKGKTAHPSVSFVISPGSKQVIENLARDGALADLYSTGARITEPVCGFCIGNSQSPQTDAVSIRTSNRNFFGRSGTKTANLYLASPETAAAAVITGKFTDPRDLELDYPLVTMPERFYTDDSMIVLPPQNPEQLKVYRGPNIGEPPSNVPMPQNISGVVTIKVGDKITTDHIIPAGARMKYRSNVPKYSEFVFEIVDDTFFKRATKIRDKGKHNIIVAGLSYGQGSSREHAALCPMFLGVKAVLAKSFERIHSANLINFGIIPLTFKAETDYDQIDSGDEIQILNIREAVSKNEPLTVKNATKNKEFQVTYELTKRQRNIILAGGMLSYIKNK
ncbi:MAG: aconitate hydratase [Candidatus Bathyarchaeum sp.]|nr:MAG: aconitate hydratase [Candidatus Bathyarchaeum sp.]